MAQKTEQEKEWVPRSHVVGARFGTLSRAAVNKAKMYSQLIDEEAEEKKLVTTRPNIGTAFTEVAFISCKNDADGRRYVEILKDLETRGAKGEAFFQLFELYPGTGTSMSKYMLVSVGSPESFVNLHKDRSDAEVAELLALTKQYHATIYTAHAADSMKELVAAINKREQSSPSGQFKRKVYSVDIAESPAYSFEGGMVLVQRYLKHVTEAKFTLRVERIATKDKSGMEKVEAALEELFSSEHRVREVQPWRPNRRKSLGFARLPNTPLAFVQKVDETHVEIVTFDDEETFAGDKDFANNSEAVKSAIEVIESVDVFVYGKSDCKQHIFAGAGEKFTVYPGTPKLNNPISDLLSQMSL